MDVIAREQAHDWQREIDPASGRETIFYRARMITTLSACQLAREVADRPDVVILTPQRADELRAEGYRNAINDLRPVFEKIGRRDGVELP